MTGQMSDAGLDRLLAAIDADQKGNEPKHEARCVSCGWPIQVGPRCGFCTGRRLSERREGLRAAGRQGR